MVVLYLLLAALGFGFVIFIHELGHFTFAKWAGVKVEVFSIGFGPKLLRWRWLDTEWTLSALPFGGYVQMLGQNDNPSAEKPKPGEAVDPRSYLAKSAGWKALILLGGVLFNFISSYLILLCLAFSGWPGMPPVVADLQIVRADAKGELVPTPAAKLGLRLGDVITEIDGHPVWRYEDVALRTIVAGSHPISVTVQRDGQTLTLPENGAQVSPVYNPDSGKPDLYLGLPQGSKIENVAGIGEDAGDVRKGDRVLAINGALLPDETPGQEILRRLRPSIGREITLTVDRAGERREVRLRYAGVGSSGTAIGFPVRITRVLAGLGAATAGVQAGDVVLAVDSQAVCGSAHLLGLIRPKMVAGDEIALRLRRAEAELTLTMRGMPSAIGPSLGIEMSDIGAGVLPFLPPGLDGSPSALSAAGVVVGDALLPVSFEENAPADGSSTDKNQSTAVRYDVLSGGSVIEIPLTIAAKLSLVKTERPSALARLLQLRQTPSLLEQMIGGQVSAVAVGASGSPATGAPALGLITLSDRHQRTRVLDLRPLGDAIVTKLLTTLQPGDWIVADAVLANGSTDGVPGLQAVRGAGPMKRVTVTPKPLGTAFSFTIEERPFHLTNAAEAFRIVNTTTYTSVVVGPALLGRFFKPPEQGGLDPNKSLTGPIGIFTELKLRAERWGFASFLKILAFVGFNLVFVNLLPIPVTDGGQLLFLGIETLIRRPLPDLVRVIAAWVGVALVAAMMLYVVGLDLGRLIP